MKKFVFFILIIISVKSYTQEDTTLIKNTEAKLMQCFKSLSVIKIDKKQSLLNDSIIKYFKEILNIPLTFTYPFDSLKNIGKLTTKDETFRFYTWNIPYEDGYHKISGFIQYKIKKDSVTYYLLSDNSSEIQNAENQILNPKSWYGALYYDVVRKKIDKKYYYFLMGYNPYNLFSNKKIIDVFYLDEYGYPFFGKPVFNFEDKITSRKIFEYNEKSAMTLHYDEKVKMIVFHHLSPIDYKYQNNPIFLAPDSSFDGLKFEDDMWKLYINIDVRNDI